MDTVRLFRPIGIKELELIISDDWKKFPPRLYWQPIFYPVLNNLYAKQIALEWNTKDEFSGYCGIVTEFDLKKEEYLKYDIQNVGGELHNELWVPAEDLELFNQQIVGPIRIINVFFGSEFIMPEDKALRLELMKFRQQD